MQLPEGELSPEAHRAIVECLKIAARRGKELRLERERAAIVHKEKGEEKAQRADAAVDSSSKAGAPEQGN